MTALQNRINAEKAITKALIAEIAKAGFMVSVFDGEQTSRNMTKTAALDLAMNVDECKIYAQKYDDQGIIKSVAVFYLVYGNDGFDCIADHSVNDVTDQIMSVINPICDKWESKLI